MTQIVCKRWKFEPGSDTSFKETTCTCSDKPEFPNCWEKSVSVDDDTQNRMIPEQQLLTTSDTKKLFRSQHINKVINHVPLSSPPISAPIKHYCDDDARSRCLTNDGVTIVCQVRAPCITASVNQNKHWRRHTSPLLSHKTECRSKLNDTAPKPIGKSTFCRVNFTANAIRSNFVIRLIDRRQFITIMRCELFPDCFIAIIKPP